MEGGLVTLIVGTILIALFTDVAREERRNQAALHAIAAASGLGLLVSGAVRNTSVLMGVGLALLAVGLISHYLQYTAPQAER
ncbi:hypothetical protein [Deinococcus yavapaiensis]|uniref:Uncharacterized protein n=1 Tax=Deinococcus yavapaiensis KR-236 TaxID=694435 RepID=A0A318S948_9DEIO|nr:hypothetical protein [Deinococcus yavapaiensis]PYE53551.1 hypothetical protein DES52_10880 [Deinococcus yavapaiensis KR-236]